MPKLMIGLFCLLTLASCNSEEPGDGDVLPSYKLVGIPGDSKVEVNFTNPIYQYATLSLIAVDWATPDSYDIYIATYPGAGFSKLTTLYGARASHEISGLENDTPYYLTVRANKKGLPSTQSDTILVVPSVQPTPTRLSQAEGTVFQKVSFSPDGQEVAFISNQVAGSTLGGVNLYSYDLQSGQVKTIQTSVEDCDWSPVENLIVFSWRLDDPNLDGATYNQLAIYDRDADSTYLLPPTDFYIMHPKFSPDGEKILYVSYNTQYESGLWLINKDGSGNRRLVAPVNDPRIADGNGAIERSDFSPDGATVFFSAYTGLSYDIFTYSLEDASLQALLATPRNEFNPSISPDGQTLAFLSDNNGRTNVWLYHLTEASLRQVTGASDDVLLEQNGSRIEWLSNQILAYNTFVPSNDIFSVDTEHD